MLLNVIIAETTDEVGVAFLDYFTWGHLMMGFIFFTLASFLHVLFRYVLNAEEKVANNFKDDPVPIWVALIITIALGALWDVVENTLFISMDIKFEGRADSALNIFSDILFVSIAGLICLILWYLILKPGEMKTAYIIYLIYIIGIIVCIVGHFIAKAMIV